MTKAEIATEIAKTTGIDKAAVLSVVEQFMAVVKDSLALKYCGITIYDDKELAKTFHDAIPELEKRLVVKIKWKPANKSDRLTFECPAHFKERDKWNEDFDWFIKYLLELKKIVYEIAK